jgi:tetratricopeptide (TPR) repeat protein
MRKVLILTALGLLCLTTIVAAQKKPAPSSAATPQSLQDLIVRGNVKEAVRVATKSPAQVPDALKTIMDGVDLNITERKIPEAKAAMDAVEKFAAALPKTGKGGPAVPTDAIQGRTARIDGIELNDAKQYEKAEAKLRQALELSTKAGDKVLEAGVHNNLGVALRNQQPGTDEKVEQAATEFDTARKMAEEQKDTLRAGSYNFNLGQALLKLGRPSAALEAFKRSADQNKAAGKTNLQARAVMYQGVSLSKIDVVSQEPVKFFDAAHKLFVTSGDEQNAGWALLLLADHLAYTSKNTESAAAGERAIPFLLKANDKPGLLRCYNLLSEMYGRLEDKKRAESYRVKAADLSK